MTFSNYQMMLFVFCELHCVSCGCVNSDTHQATEYNSIQSVALFYHNISCDRERAEAAARTEAEKRLSRDLQVENMRVKEQLFKTSTDSDNQKAEIADLRADIQRYVNQVIIEFKKKQVLTDSHNIIFLRACPENQLMKRINALY